MSSIYSLIASIPLTHMSLVSSKSKYKDRLHDRCYYNDNCYEHNDVVYNYKHRRKKTRK